jgi:hypothetical protein
VGSRPQPQGLAEIAFRQVQPLDSVFGKPCHDERHLHPGPAHERVDIVRIEFKRAVEMLAGLTQKFRAVAVIKCEPEK